MAGFVKDNILAVRGIILYELKGWGREIAPYSFARKGADNLCVGFGPVADCEGGATELIVEVRVKRRIEEELGELVRTAVDGMGKCGFRCHFSLQGLWVS